MQNNSTRYITRIFVIIDDFLSMKINPSINPNLPTNFRIQIMTDSVDN